MSATPHIEPTATLHTNRSRTIWWTCGAIGSDGWVDAAVLTVSHNPRDGYRARLSREERRPDRLGAMRLRIGVPYHLVLSATSRRFHAGTFARFTDNAVAEVRQLFDRGDPAAHEVFVAA